MTRGMTLACSCTVVGCGLAMLHVTGSGPVGVRSRTSSRMAGCALSNSGSFQDSELTRVRAGDALLGVEGVVWQVLLA